MLHRISAAAVTVRLRGNEKPNTHRDDWDGCSGAG